VDEFGPAGPSLTLANGTVLTGDLIIGADGIRSRTRASILRERDLQAVASPNYAYRATVPAAIMNGDPEIAHLMTDINSNCWIGPERHIMAYPIRNGEMYNIVMSHPEEGAADGAWNQPGDLNEMRAHYANWDPLIRKVLSHVTGCMKWKLAKMPALPTWVSDNGKVVIIGDAAHGMVPYLAQGAAVAIEDGAALAECVSRAESVDDLPALLKAFEAIRKPRSELISDAAMENGKIWHYADGPEQQERDRKMQLTPEQQEAEDEARSAHVENPNKWSDKNFQPWLFGYDTIKETNDFLDGLKLGSEAAQSKVAEVSML
jgi:salicylate hydroxylase